MSYAALQKTTIIEFKLDKSFNVAHEMPTEDKNKFMCAIVLLTQPYHTM